MSALVIHWQKLYRQPLGVEAEWPLLKLDAIEADLVLSIRLWQLAAQHSSTRARRLKTAGPSAGGASVRAWLQASAMKLVADRGLGAAPIE